MINRVVLVGRITKDIELRYTPAGKAWTKITLAVNRQFTNQDGKREADFIPVVAWGKQAENLANFMKKGSQIGVEGRIVTGSFEGADGKRVYTTDVNADSIQFLEPRSNSGNNSYQQNSYQNNNQPNSYQNNNQQNNYQDTNHDPFSGSQPPIEVTEDDLPF